MTIILCGHTALEFWRWSSIRNSMYVNPSLCNRTTVSESWPTAKDIIVACDFFQPELPIEVLVSGTTKRRNSENVRYRKTSLNLPRRSIYSITDQLYVISPELTLLLASNLNFAEFLMLGFELSGLYTMDYNHSKGFSESPPLTSPNKIFQVANHGSRWFDSRKLGHLSEHIIANSRSPMESELALVLSLPKKYGGYGLPKPVLNRKLDLSKNYTVSLLRSSITPDLQWPDKRVALEYESDSEHSGEDKFKEDSKRRNYIRSLGYDVTTITRNEFYNFRIMDNFANDLRKRLGVKKRPYPKDYQHKQYELRRLLKGLRIKNMKLQKKAYEKYEFMQD